VLAARQEVKRVVFFFLILFTLETNPARYSTNSCCVLHTHTHTHTHFKTLSALLTVCACKSLLNLLLKNK